MVCQQNGKIWRQAVKDLHLGSLLRIVNETMVDGSHLAAGAFAVALAYAHACGAADMMSILMVGILHGIFVAWHVTGIKKLLDGDGFRLTGKVLFPDDCL